MKEIVLIGGGTGMSTIARYLKLLNTKLTLVVTITDDGGSSGILRQIMSMPPPGDIRSNLVALAEDETLLQRIFAFRFSSEGIQKHSLGNLIIAGLAEILGSFPDAVRASSRLLRTRGDVLPASGEEVHLMAELLDGRVVHGETAVSLVGPMIKRVFLDREVEPIPEVIERLRTCDCILVGPGSLYTSIVSNFLISGVAEAFRSSSAQVMYISNIMTQPGETEGFSLRRHVETVESYSGRSFDRIFCTTAGHINPDILSEYASKGAFPVNNDMINDRRVELINSLSVEQSYEEIEKYVIRHSAESVMQIARKLGIVDEESHEFC